MFWITGGAGVFTALAKEKIMTRRQFIGSAAVVAAVGGASGGRALPGEIRGVLLHMGMNMWGEWLAPGEPKVEGRR